MMKIMTEMRTLCEERTKSINQFALKINLQIFFLFLIIANLMIIALPNGFETKIGNIGIPNTSTPEEIRAAWGAGDAGSMLDIAITWSKFKDLDPVTQFWIPNLWSPGMALVEVPLIWLTKVGIPIFWSLLVLTISLWIVIFLLILSMFKKRTRKTLGFFVIVLYINSWDFQYFLREGLFYTEGLAYGLLFLGLLYASKTLALASTREIKNKKLVAAGALIGASIWIRHTQDAGMITTLVFLFLLLNFSRIQSYFKLRSVKKKNELYAQELKIKFEFQQFIKKAISIFLIALIFTMPWRVIAGEKFHGTPGMMSSASQLVGPGLWFKESSQAKNMWIPNGINWACKVDPVKCKEINEKGPDNFKYSKLIQLAIISAVTDPATYLHERFATLMNYWIPNFAESSLKLKFGAVFPLLLFFLLPRIVQTNLQQKKLLIASFWLVFITLNLMQLAIIHFESRYFIPVRLFSIGIFLSLIQDFVLPEKRIKQLKK